MSASKCPKLRFICHQTHQENQIPDPGMITKCGTYLYAYICVQGCVQIVQIKLSSLPLSERERLKMNLLVELEFFSNLPKYLAGGANSSSALSCKSTQFVSLLNGAWISWILIQRKKTALTALLRNFWCLAKMFDIYNLQWSMQSQAAVLFRKMTFFVIGM